MFLTISANQQPTLAGEALRAWPAVELEFEQPVFWCSWSDALTFDAVRGTVLVIFERDLREWLVRPKNGPCLRYLQLAEPAEIGWQFRHIRAVWEERSDEVKTKILVFEDVKGSRSTLWKSAIVPQIASNPIWTCRVNQYLDIQECHAQETSLDKQPMAAASHRPRPADDGSVAD